MTTQPTPKLMTGPTFDEMLHPEKITSPMQNTSEQKRDILNTSPWSPHCQTGTDSPRPREGCLRTVRLKSIDRSKPVRAIVTRG